MYYNINVSKTFHIVFDTNAYFIGLPWLHTRGSATLGGIKKDAKYLANKILKK